LLLPLAPTPASAFSQVQAHFRDFRTLRFDMTQSMPGHGEGFATRVSMTRDGKVRTDIGKDLSVVVNPVERRVLMLSHRERIATEAPFVGTPKEDGLEWLREVRDFQGIATPLPQSRVIDGRQVHGWRLPVGTIELELWATDEGLPLEMTMKGAGEMRFDFRFEFDVAFAPEIFSTAIPAGYSPGNAEDR
jgi:hypothetical protein